MKHWLLVALFVGAVSAYAAAPCDAKQGLYLGLDLVYDSIGGDLDDPDLIEVDPGAGFDLRLGYTFAVPISLELNWGGSGHDADGEEAGLGWLALALRYAFLADGPVNPYLRLGLGAYAFVIDEFDLELTGGAFDIGAGVDYFLTDNVSLNGAVTYRMIEFDEEDGDPLDEEIDAETVSVSVGAQYHF